MLTLRYALERGGPRDLAVGFQDDKSEVTIDLAGQRIGSFADGAAARSGGEFALPDGSTLFVARLPLGFYVLRDGRPVAGMPQPAKHFQVTWKLVLVLGAIHLLMGLLNATGAMQSRTLRLDAASAWAMTIAGASLCLLAVAIRQFRSRAALALAAVVFAGGTVYAIAANAGAVAAWVSVAKAAVSLLLLIGLLSGFGAIANVEAVERLERQRSAQHAPPAEAGD